MTMIQNCNTTQISNKQKTRPSKVENVVNGVIVNVAYETLDAELLCPHCKSPCSVNENIIICSKPKCNTASTLSKAKCVLNEIFILQP